MTVSIPTVLWAQRSNFILLTIQLSQPTDEQLTLGQSSFAYSCTSESKRYSLNLDFLHNVSICSRSPNQHQIELKIEKEEPGYWERLTKNPSKLHYLKTDFNKWIDEEDEQGSVNDEMDFSHFQMTDAIKGMQKSEEESNFEISE